MERVMKVLVRSTFLFAILLQAIALVSCGVTEPTLTPPDKQLKQASATTVSINKIGEGDTLVYLKKSKLKFKLKKEFTKEQIALIDEYLATHEIPTVSDTIISPMRVLCGTHDSYGYAWGNSYRPYPDKYLGIALSQDVVTYSNAKWKYGFSKIFVWGDYDIGLAQSAGFSYDNMMFGIASPQQEIPTNLGAYHIDEAFENHTDIWNASTISLKAGTVSSKRVMLSSYWWPSRLVGSFPGPYYTIGSEYGDAINSSSNIYIMCDEYHGNCFGTVDDYWNEFRNYYGATKNISNWLNLTANNGDGRTHVACPFINSHSNNWYDLLGNANRNGINEVWLWASGTGNETLVNDFSEQAWSRDWLLRAYGYYCIEWGCDTQPCYPDCHWGVGLGPWYVKQIYKLGDDAYLPYSNSAQ